MSIYSSLAEKGFLGEYLKEIALNVREAKKQADIARSYAQLRPGTAAQRYADIAAKNAESAAEISGFKAIFGNHSKNIEWTKRYANEAVENMRLAADSAGPEFRLYTESDPQTQVREILGGVRGQSSNINENIDGKVRFAKRLSYSSGEMVAAVEQRFEQTQSEINLESFPLSGRFIAAGRIKRAKKAIGDSAKLAESIRDGAGSVKRYAVRLTNMLELFSNVSSRGDELPVAVSNDTAKTTIRAAEDLQYATARLSELDIEADRAVNTAEKFMRKLKKQVANNQTRMVKNAGKGSKTRVR